MAWNDLNPLKLPSEIISNVFLLLLRSFWVVSWSHDQFTCLFWLWGQKWPKMAEKGPKWPKLAWMPGKWHPGFRGGQKWSKCIPTSPILKMNSEKNIFGRSKKLTYFFTRNVPPQSQSCMAVSESLSQFSVSYSSSSSAVFSLVILHLRTNVIAFTSYCNAWFLLELNSTFVLYLYCHSIGGLGCLV